MKKVNLTRLGIKPLRKLNEKEKSFISNYIADKLREKYPYLTFTYLDIVFILYNTDMYFSQNSNNISSVNYIYQNQTIYFSKDKNVFDIDEFIIHECIHRIEDRRKKKQRLEQLGNCEFTDTKINGLFLNEAAIQYVVAKMLNKSKKKIENYGIRINTINDTYYSLISNIIEQLVLLLGETQLVRSTIHGDNDFNYQIIDAIGVKEFYKVREGLDNIQYLQDEMNVKSNIDNKNKIQEIYYDIQKTIYENYFNKMISYIDKIEETEELQEKLKDYADFISISDDYETFKRFYEIKKVEIEKVKAKIKAKQALVPINQSVWNKIAFKFKNLFRYGNSDREYFK